MPKRLWSTHIKMKIPKSVIIAGKTYRVKTDNSGGGSFDGVKGIITIGTKYKQDISSIFFHECFEAICSERGYRYRYYSDCDNNTKFVFDHNEFQRIIEDFTLAIGDVLKK